MSGVSGSTDVEYKRACLTLFTEYREKMSLNASRNRNIAITVFAISVLLSLGLFFTATHLTLGKIGLVITILTAVVFLARTIGTNYMANKWKTTQTTKNGAQIPHTELDELKNVSYTELENTRISPSNEYDRKPLKNLSLTELNALNIYMIGADSDKILSFYNKPSTETDPMQKLVNAMRKRRIAESMS